MGAECGDVILFLSVMLGEGGEGGFAGEEGRPTSRLWGIDCIFFYVET